MGSATGKAPAPKPREAMAMTRTDHRREPTRLALAGTIALAACGGGATHGAAGPSVDASDEGLSDAAEPEADAPRDSRSGSPDGGADVLRDGGPPATPRTCDDLASLVCGTVQSCAPFWLTIFLGDVDTCAGRIKDMCGHLDAS